MIYILRTNDIIRDPRVNKYLKLYKENNLKCKSIAWNREELDELKDNEDIIFYKKKSPHGGGIQNIKRLIIWNIFLLKKLIKERKNYEYIHACDFDTILPSCFMKLFNKKIIFDIFDVYTDSRDINNKILKKILVLLERISIKVSDLIIICEEERNKQIGYKNHKKVLVIPNIPDLNYKNIEKKDIFKNNKINLSYVGILEEHRGLKELLEVVSENKLLELNIAGFGSLEEEVLFFSKKFNNIKYHGKVEYDKGIEIMNNSDIIVAFYHKTIKNHFYAAPNKYYESLFLGKCLLTTSGTLVGNKTKKYQTGIDIEEDIYILKRTLENISFEEIVEIQKNSKKLWNDKYKNYLKDIAYKEYLNYINKR